MYIQPTANLYLLSGCPCDADYTNTLWFSRNQQIDQYNYFYSLAKYKFYNFNTIRINRNTIRVPVNSESLYDVNYLMFQNEHFGNKWFYGFVTKVDYISNGVTEITFDIDKIQTWLFDFELNSTFVEREHTATDEVGDNIVPESFDLGETVFNNYQQVPNTIFSARNVVILAITEIDSQKYASGQIYDNVYGGATLYVYHNTEDALDRLNRKVGLQIATPENIVGLYIAPFDLLPSTMLTDGDFTDGAKIPSNINTNYNVGNLPKLTGDETVDGHAVVNKKLLTYPYNYLHIDNASGDDLILRYEYFADAPKLYIEGCYTQPVQLVLKPMNYKGVGNKALHTEMLTLSNYPQCSINFNGYQQWLSQNLVPMALSTVKGIGTTLLAGAVTGGAGAIATDTIFANKGLAMAGAGLSTITNLLSQGYSASIQSNDTRGGIKNGSVNIANFEQTFYYGRKSINRQTAEIIDDFFTRYGYAVKRVKKPSLRNREKWTYLKTVGCTISSKMPTDDERIICSIFDRGITFWTNPSQVGHYELTNPTLVG